MTLAEEGRKLKDLKLEDDYHDETAKGERDYVLAETHALK